jgi:hypothetical protein
MTTDLDQPCLLTPDDLEEQRERTQRQLRFLADVSALADFRRAYSSRFARRPTQADEGEQMALLEVRG